jgi:hypothetical protein
MCKAGWRSAGALAGPGFRHISGLRDRNEAPPQLAAEGLVGEPAMPFGGNGDAEKSFMRAGTRDGGSELTATGRAHGPSSLFSTPTPPRRGFSLPMRAAAKKAPGAPAAPCIRSCVRDRAARGSATCCLPSSSRCRERLFGRAVRDARGRCRPRLADPLHDSGVSWPSHEWSEPWLSPSRRPSLTICRNSVPVHSRFAAADGNWRRSIDFLSARRSCFGQFLP